MGCLKDLMTYHPVILVAANIYLHLPVRYTILSRASVVDTATAKVPLQEQSTHFPAAGTMLKSSPRLSVFCTGS